MVFGVIESIVYLYGMYRDDHIRMWSAKTGQCVSVVNCVPNNSETRARGCKSYNVYFYKKDLRMTTFINMLIVDLFLQQEIICCERHLQICCVHSYAMRMALNLLQFEW